MMSRVGDNESLEMGHKVVYCALWLWTVNRGSERTRDASAIVELHLGSGDQDACVCCRRPRMGARPGMDYLVLGEVGIWRASATQTSVGVDGYLR